MVRDNTIKGSIAEIIKATDIIRSILEIESDSIGPNNKTMMTYALDRIDDYANTIQNRVDDIE